MPHPLLTTIMAPMEGSAPVPEHEARAILEAAMRLASDKDAQRLDRLDERLQALRLRVLVVGEAKRGKSTLVNALLGRDILPTSVTPLTSVATTVTAAAADSGEDALVLREDRSEETVALSRLPDFVTEKGNPRNSRGVAEVRVRLHNPLLDAYSVDLVDTPGTGSVVTHNTVDARAAMATLDAAILVLTVDPPISQAERDIFQEVSALSLQTFVVLNKSDRLTSEEIDEAVRFTEDVCREITHSAVVVHSCAARRAEHDAGFVAFAATFTAYLAERSVADATLAVHQHLGRVLTGMLDEARIRLGAIDLAEQGNSQTSHQLQGLLANISARRESVTDRCDGSVRRLRAELDTSAGAALRGTAERCRRHLAQWWSSHAEQVPVDELEPAARGALEAFITRQVDAWRATASERLETGLATVADEATSDVNAQLRLASDAVQRVFRVTLSVRADVAALPADARFHYDYTPATGWAPPLRGTISRLATAGRRRARIRTSVEADAAGLVDRQLGRARADLQQRLREAHSALSAALEEQLADTLDRLSDLVSELAADVAAGAETSAGRPAQREALAARIEALDELIARSRS